MNLLIFSNHIRSAAALSASVLVLALVVGCDAPAPPSKATVQQPPAAAVLEKAAESRKPGVNISATETLYGKVTGREVGAGPGLVEFRDNSGILIHPGTTPTDVLFDVSQMSGPANLVFWISNLPQDALNNPQSGTAAVEVFLDGVSQGRKKVDRQTNESLAVNLTGVSTMRVVVDDADGVQLFDWFFLAVD